MKPKYLERQGWRLTADATNSLHNWTGFFRSLSCCGRIWIMSDIDFYQGLEKKSWPCPRIFSCISFHKQIQTKIKLEDQTLGPGQTFKRTHANLTDFRHVTQWINVELEPDKYWSVTQKARRGIHRHATCSQTSDPDIDILPNPER